MSGPLFIRDPRVGINQAIISPETDFGILGRTLPPSTLADWKELFFEVEEPILVESLRYCAHSYSTEAGQIVVGLKNEEYGHGGYVYIVGAFAVAAGDALPGPFASDEIDIDLTIPSGWTLVVMHNVKVSGGGSFATLDITAHSGVVR
jgi:hypothetical protein